MSKYTHIRVNTPNGVFDIPAKPVAIERAIYYAIEVDGYKTGSHEFNSEVEHGLNNGYDLIDWVLNNSNWEDHEADSVKVSDAVKVTSDDFWTCSDDFELVTKP